MSGQQADANFTAYPAKLRPAQRILVLLMALLSPWLAILLVARLFW
jgi:hypothetical protein